MAPTAGVILLVYLLLSFVGRAILQLALTGSLGLKGIGGEPFSVEWSGGVLFVVALVLALLAPVADLLGVVEPVADVWGVHTMGLALSLLGIFGTLYAQVAMGASWRVGVDRTEETELVTGGPFRLARNPIFSLMVLTLFGFALMVFNHLVFAALVALILALQIQVRLVEEPYLLDVHGARYAEYASRVGRFVPGVGLMRPPTVR